MATHNSKLSQQALARQGGFSLIEILVVLVIMGLLISIVAPNVLDRSDDARIQKARADFKSIETALKLYRLDNFTYPTSEQGLDALVSKPSIEPVPTKYRDSGYLESLPIDPWGRKYLFLAPGESGKDYDLYTLGADGVRGGEGQNADLTNWDTPDSEDQ